MWSRFLARANGRTGERTNEGVLRGPRGPKNPSKSIQNPSMISPGANSDIGLHGVEKTGQHSRSNVTVSTKGKNLKQKDVSQSVSGVKHLLIKIYEREWQNNVLRPKCEGSFTWYRFVSSAFKLLVHDDEMMRNAKRLDIASCFPPCSNSTGSNFSL